MTAASPPRAVPETVREDLLAALEVADRHPGADATGLAEVLYTDWYLGLPGAPPDEPPAAPEPVDIALVDLLRDAHVDAGRFEPGWTVEGVSSQGRVAVVRDGRQRILARVDVLPSVRACLPPRPGETVRAVARRDALDEATAFWFTYGGDWDEAAELPPELVRVYWHVRRRAVPELVGVLTEHLAEARVPYSLKVAVADPDVERPDRAVLYLTRDAYAAAAPAIRRAHGAVTSCLLPGVPRLTRHLAPGLAVADDPGTGESFGQQRCGLVAEALRGERANMTANADERAAVVVEHLAATGHDPARPYLRVGSDEDHPWPSA
jgi:hypothetical protein